MRKWRVYIVRQCTRGSVPGFSAAGLTPFSLSVSQTSAPCSSSLPAAARAGAAKKNDDDNDNVTAATSRPALPIARHTIAPQVLWTRRFGTLSGF